MRFTTLIICIIFSSCSRNPYTGKKSLLLLSEETEISQGEQAYQEVLKKERVITSGRQYQVLQRVSQRLAAVANRPYFQWEFKLIDKNIPNAFCLPGGKIAVYTGILSVAKNEAGLAAIIGHEIGHALARHGGQRVSQNILLQSGMALGALAASTKIEDKQKRNMIMAALGVGATVGIVLPYGRKHEYEADAIGIELMSKAGYDPRESVRLWQRMGQLSGGKSPPEFLSTHPASSNRSERLNQLVPKYLPIYQRSNGYGLGVDL